MAIKIDLSKAYDKVEWGVLAHILIRLGFNNSLLILYSTVSQPHCSHSS